MDMQGPYHSKVWRKQIVQGPHPVRSLDRPDGVEMANLAFCVGTAVSPARAYDVCVFVRDVADSLTERAMDRPLAVLWRPTTKVVAIVGNGQFDASDFRVSLG